MLSSRLVVSWRVSPLPVLIRATSQSASPDLNLITPELTHMIYSLILMFLILLNIIPIWIFNGHNLHFNLQRDSYTEVRRWMGVLWMLLKLLLPFSSTRAPRQWKSGSGHPLDREERKLPHTGSVRSHVTWLNNHWTTHHEIWVLVLALSWTCCKTYS